jgi:hypothetical protein
MEKKFYAVAHRQANVSSSSSSLPFLLQTDRAGIGFAFAQLMCWSSKASGRLGAFTTKNVVVYHGRFLSQIIKILP